MKQGILLLCVSLLLTACDSPASAVIADGTQPPVETTVQTTNTTQYPVSSQAYTLLSQYLARQPNGRRLKNCRMLGGGAYLLCFQNAEDSYEIEYTTLAHGRESYMTSADNVHTAADGFWVMDSAADGSAAMEWDDARYSGLHSYSDSLGLLAYADLSPLGMIDAWTVDLHDRTTYAVKQTAEGLCVEQLGFFRDAPQTICTLAPSDTEPYPEQISALHISGHLLLLLGTAHADGTSVPCFGSISLQRGSVWLHPCPDSGQLAMATFDGGAYFYDPSKPTGVIYRLGDAAETKITLGDAAESQMVFSSQSGAYFATCVPIGTEAVEITVYDADGGRITKSVSHESSEISDSIQMYFDEDANHLLYCAAADDWREILF